MKKKVFFTLLLFSLILACKPDNNTNSKEVTDSIANTTLDSNILIEDPLPSWNDTDNKKAIINFVDSVTTPGSSMYIEPEDRIATFDNDGTLWTEKPTYFQIEFVLYRIKQMAPQHKEWKRDKLIKAALNHDLEKIRQKFGVGGMNKLMSLAQSGMTVEKFYKIVQDWISKGKHPITKKKFTEMVYQPMLELIEYLQKNEFKVYIVSGGGIDFMRAWSADVYGIEPEYVIGSFARPVYKKINGKPVLIKTDRLILINNESGKVVSIHQVIGKKPVISIGNSDGDIQMLEWCSSNEKASLSGFVHHTDAKREWAYDKNTNTGKLNRGLSLAKKNSWMLIDMKKDWKVIYPFELNQQTAQK